MVEFVIEMWVVLGIWKIHRSNIIPWMIVGVHPKRWCVFKVFVQGG